MPLHRDIFWVGRQWAVTGHGMQAVDQRLKGKFDIEASRIWENGLVESLHAGDWLNKDDFAKALAVARKQYPEPPRTAVPSERSALRLQDSNAVAQPKPAVPEPTVPEFELRIESWPAKFVRTWRVSVYR